MGLTFDESYITLRDLETERLCLRKLTMRDAPDLFDYCRDPEVARHVLWDAHTSISDAKGYLRYMLRRYRLGEPASWGIELKSTGHVIGTIGYMWYQRDNNASEIGYSLAHAQWNHGYMTEALRAVIDYSFDEMHMHRVEAQHETDNPASGAVMRKCGMRHEGTLRGRLFNKGRYVDVELYALLREDWLRRSKLHENITH